jgi:tetratricopeptide (TPR) repeat protein
MKTIRIIVGLFLVLNPQLFFAQGTDEADVLLKAGKDKTKQKDYYGAVRDFNRVLKLRPEFPEALSGRALARNFIGDSDAALADANAAVELSPKSAGIVFTRAEINFAQKKYPQALLDYSKTIELQPDFSDAFRGKILSMFLSGKDKEASELVESSIKSRPDVSLNYYLRGLLLSLKQKYAKSLDDFDKAIALEPGDNAANCYMNRGIAFLGVEEFDNAKNDLDKSIGIDTSNVVAYLSRGRANYNLKNYEEAVSDFNHVITANPTNDAAWYNLGMTYFRIENKSMACQSFHKSCSMGNNNACRMIVMECSEVKQ